MQMIVLEIKDVFVMTLWCRIHKINVYLRNWVPKTSAQYCTLSKDIST